VVDVLGGFIKIGKRTGFGVRFFCFLGVKKVKKIENGTEVERYRNISGTKEKV